jgi:hypothetical protein
VRWWRAAAAAGLGVAVIVASQVPAGAGGAEDRRVLVISIPGLTWEDVNGSDVPHLQALLDESAVANVALRVERLATEPAEGYATLSSGTRSVAPRAIGGLAFNRAEQFGSSEAGDEWARQHGRPAEGEVVILSWPQLVRENEGSDFEAGVGLLGEALASAGVDRGVIGNADGVDALAPFEPPHREAAIALSDDEGIVPCGDVSRSLLVDDRGAPFGVRLDRARVLTSTARCATPRSVVLVEASDVRRATVFAQRLGGAAAERLRARALEDADDLVGELLELVDLERDAVVVVAPSVAPADARLTVLGVHATEYEPGLLVSGTTRQAGYVTLGDVAPTIAALASAPLDEAEIEGRQAEVVQPSSRAVERRKDLEDGDAAARFRNEVLTPVAATYITSISLLGIATTIALWRRIRVERWLEAAALVLLGALPMTYLAGFFPFYDWGGVAYGAFVIGGALVFGLGCHALRRAWLNPLLVAYGVLIAIVVISVVLLDSRLQLGTVFGDSAIIAGRFSGVNNVTFAQLIIAAIVLSIVVVHRAPGRRGQVIAAALLSGLLLVVATPMWGADVGGALSGAPALALVFAKLSGWPVRVRTVVICGVVTVVLVVGLGLLDLTRDSADRTHLGRLFERIDADGFDGFVTVVERKLATNLRSLTNSVWRFVLPPVLLFVAVLAWKAPGRLQDLWRALPELRAALPGLLAAGLLGYALNDSGMAVPGMMLAALVPGVVYLLARVEAGEPAVE